MSGRDPMAEPSDINVDELRRRARRRLVGAVVLALAVAVIVPMLLESEEKPLGEDVSVKIPPIDDSKFVNRLSENRDKDSAKSAVKPAQTAKDDIAATTRPPSDAERTGKYDTRLPDAGVAAQTPAMSAADTGKGSAPSPTDAKSTSQPSTASSGGATSPSTASSTPSSIAAATPAQGAAPATSDATPSPSAATSSAQQLPGASATQKSANGGKAGTDIERSKASAADKSSHADTKVATAAPAATPRAPTSETKSEGHDGFAVQLAAFADDKGANALVGRLKRSGYTAYTEPLKTSKGTLWRVRVGPYPSREAAVAARDRLKSEGQSGIVAAVK